MFGRPAHLLALLWHKQLLIPKPFRTVHSLTLDILPDGGNEPNHSVWSRYHVKLLPEAGYGHAYSSARITTAHDLSVARSGRPIIPGNQGFYSSYLVLCVLESVPQTIRAQPKGSITSATSATGFFSPTSGRLSTGVCSRRWYRA